MNEGKIYRAKVESSMIDGMKDNTRKQWNYSNMTNMLTFDETRKQWVACKTKEAFLHDCYKYSFEYGPT